jgi:SWI/SNF-related matrix-associated actin-dependent regulator 1 of chromatin subfamily A
VAAVTNASSNSPTNSQQGKADVPVKAAATKKKILVNLMSSSRLSVSFPYDTALIAQVRKLRSASYDPKTKKWDVALSDYKNLIEQLKQLDGGGIVLDAESVPTRVVSFIISEQKDQPVDLSERLPHHFIENLFPFQREGIKFAIRRNGRCIIADDMGLGKTVQALGAAYWFREDWPLIIVCPASVTRTWQQAILKWIDFVTPDDISIADSPSQFPNTRIVIMSYERLSRSTEDVMRRKANFVIFDESHSIKSGESQRTRSALQVAKAAQRVILLSGTPALSRPMELYTQIFAVNRKVFPNKHDFGLRYCGAKFRFVGPRQIWDYKGNSNTDELRILLESTVMIRRLKKDVLQDLPKKNRTIVNITVDLTSEEEKQNREFQNRLSGDLGRIRDQDKRKELMEWFNASAEIKAPAVVSYLKDKLKRVNKLICFAYHKNMVEYLCDYLNQSNISFIVITGQTLPKVRQDCCNAFQEKDYVRVAVVSVVAAGVGITLTAAHHVLFAELFWNPGILIQAEDRAHRIGQEEKVVVEYLLAKGTIDDVIWPMVGRKLNVLNKVGLSKDSMSDSALRDRNQSVIEDYFSKAKIKVEPDEEADDEPVENDLSNLMDELPEEEEPVTRYNGIVCSQAVPAAKRSQSTPTVVSLDDDDDEEYKFDDDDLFLD